jgi:hypothetical protein
MAATGPSSEARANVSRVFAELLREFYPDVIWTVSSPNVRVGVKLRSRVLALAGESASLSLPRQRIVIRV